jgi:large subunit ribosomal protein L6
MSRIGKQPISLPKGVKVTIDSGVFTAEGPKGKVSQRLFPGFAVQQDGDTVTVGRPGDAGPERSLHGLLRSLLANAVHGAGNGFSKELEIIGVGYKAEVKGRDVHFALGYSHPVVFPTPEGISIEVDSKANRIKVQGADKQQVGQVAAEIRSLRRPDPYKGKGIKYAQEVLRRKVGKAGGK